MEIFLGIPGIPRLFVWAKMITVGQGKSFEKKNSEVQTIRKNNYSKEIYSELDIEIIKRRV